MIEFKVQVPCTPLVKAHLENQYGSPVHFSKGVSQTLFYSLVERCVERSDMKKKALQDSVDILITESIYLRRGIYLTQKAIYDFNTGITDQVYDMLFMYMDLVRKNKKVRLRKKDCIEIFCDHLKLPEESFSYDRAKKAYWRHVYKNKILKPRA